MKIHQSPRLFTKPKFCRQTKTWKILTRTWQICAVALWAAEKTTDTLASWSAISGDETINSNPWPFYTLIRFRTLELNGRKPPVWSFADGKTTSQKKVQLVKWKIREDWKPTRYISVFDGVIIAVLEREFLDRAHKKCYFQFIQEQQKSGSKFSIKKMKICAWKQSIRMATF